MKIYELTKELNITTAQVLEVIGADSIDGKGAAHFKSITDEQVEAVRQRYPVATAPAEEAPKKVQKTETVQTRPQKKFAVGDVIPCRSVTNHMIVAISPKTGQRYTWTGFGDVCDVDYGDLLAWKSNKLNLIFAPRIMIEDEDLLYNWSKELMGKYESFYGVENPYEYFDIPDAEFSAFIKSAPKSVAYLIKTAAITLIKEGKFDSVQKLKIMDEVFGTLLTEFIS